MNRDNWADAPDMDPAARRLTRMNPYVRIAVFVALVIVLFYLVITLGRSIAP
jgi:hypothetical protein